MWNVLLVTVLRAACVIYLVGVNVRWYGFGEEVGAHGSSLEVKVQCSRVLVGHYRHRERERNQFNIHIWLIVVFFFCSSQMLMRLALTVFLSYVVARCQEMFTLCELLMRDWCDSGSCCRKLLTSFSQHHQTCDKHCCYC